MGNCARSVTVGGEDEFPPNVYTECLSAFKQLAACLCQLDVLFHRNHCKSYTRDLLYQIVSTQRDMHLPFVSANKMDLDASTVALGGVAALMLFAVTTLYSKLRTNRRYSALGASPPAVVTSDLLGMFFLLITNW